MGDCGVGRTGGDSDNKASPKIGRFGCAILEIVESSLPPACLNIVEHTTPLRLQKMIILF